MNLKKNPSKIKYKKIVWKIFIDEEDVIVKTVLLNIAKGEKEYVGEFQTLLLKFDKEQVEWLEEDKKEVKELTS